MKIQITMKAWRLMKTHEGRSRPLSAVDLTAARGGLGDC